MYYNGPHFSIEIPMIIIPAIDLKDGRCVRLRQGRAEDVTVYSDDPVQTAMRWASEGAEIIHIVDLDGAFSGNQKNLESIKKIRQAVDVVLQVGGGIRSMDTIKALLEIGINRVILGTVAIKDPSLLRKAAEAHPEQIIVGIDARDGKVAIKGWQEVTEIDALHFAREIQGLPLAGIVYTDIKRDGMLTGPNIETTRAMVQNLRLPVIASGGISSIEDIKALKSIEGLFGAITGKALYSGAINLKEAIAVARS